MLKDNEVKSSISWASIAIDVKNSDGIDLPFTSNGNVEVTNSFCLYETDGEDGKTSRETFASGAVAIQLQNVEYGWSQIIDKVLEEDGYETALTPEEFPRYIPIGENGNRTETVYRVYEISYCDGTSAKFTNNSTRSYTVHKPAQVLEWIWDSVFCDAKVKCALCGAEETVVAHVELDYTYVPVRGDYTATILDPNGEPYTDENGNVFSDELTIISIPIESMIGMTNVEVVYDASYIYPEEIMNNHRLNDGDPAPAFREYEVYFVNPATGERYVEIGYDYYGQPYEYAASVSDVGVYDLLVIGFNDYEGQEYTFRGALTILPAVVEIEPHDVYKYFDDTTSFEPDFTLINTEIADNYNGMYKVIYGPAESSAEGIYEISVSVQNNTNDKNVSFVLTRSTVRAIILPALYVEIQDMGYPTSFTYGDTIPAPDDSYFKASDGSELTFEWYIAETTDNFEEKYVNGEYITVHSYEILSLKKIDDVPKDIGEYILRVKAKGVGNLAASYIDVLVCIEPRSTLSLTFGLDGYENVDNHYIINSGDEISYEIHGLMPGDTVESAGIHVSMSVYTAELLNWASNSFPTVPNSEGYLVTYTVYSENGNYTEAEGNDYSFRVTILAERANVIAAGADLVYDGGAHSIDVTFSWNKYEEYTSSYTIKITAPSGETSEMVKTAGDNLWNDMKADNVFATYSLNEDGTYSVEIYASDTLVDSFEFNVQFIDENGEAVSNITEIGKYQVKISDAENTYENTADVYVKQEIVMLVKECEYDLDQTDFLLEPTMIVMEAGKVFKLGHTLVDATVFVSSYNGQISVTSIKVIDENGKDVSHLYVLNTYYPSWSHDNEKGRNVAHIFDSYCDSTCNAPNCEYTRQRTHSGGTATCTDLAICDYCLSPYGSYSTENHVSDSTHIAPSGTDLETHLLINSCCGQISKILPHTPLSPATCTDLAVCADCGRKYGEVDPENHASDEYTCTPMDGESHTLLHLCCGSEEILTHSGGEADCQNVASCLYCGEQYGEIDPDNHKGHIEYTPDANNRDLHHEKYNCCNTGKFVAHSGGTETCISLAVCALCHTEYGNIDPENHTNENIIYTVMDDNGSMHSMSRQCCGEYLGKEYHSGGESNCISLAVCQHCSSEYSTGYDSVTHASDDFAYIPDANNAEMHIKVHACCNVEASRDRHTGGEATCINGRVCEHCELEYTETAEHVYSDACTSICSVCEKQTRAKSFHVDSDKDNQCDHCGAELEKEKLSGVAISAIVTASTVIGGSGIFALLWFVIKKKSLA